LSGLPQKEILEHEVPFAAGERAAELNDDAAALAYACEIVRELMQSLGTLTAVLGEG
jgi:hypothetical protein